MVSLSEVMRYGRMEYGMGDYARRRVYLMGWNMGEWIMQVGELSQYACFEGRGRGFLARCDAMRCDARKMEYGLWHVDGIMQVGEMAPVRLLGCLH